MAQVLILARDSVLSAVLADRLETIGHRVECMADPLRLIEATSKRSADLLVLDLDVGGIPAAELVKTLRRQESTRTAGVLAYSADTDPAQRLAALRSGVDDILPSEIEVEELVLRIQRVLGSRTGQLPLLQGSLAEHQLIEFLQYIRHSRRSGRLRIQSRQGSGHAVVVKGEVTSAAWDELRGSSALLAILGLQAGSFRLDPSADDDEPAVPTDTLDLQDVVLRAAWLEDLLGVWRGRVPPSSAGLELADAARVDTLDEEFEDLPHAEILRLASAPEGIRLFDLRSKAAAAPQELELSLALLLDVGALRIQEVGGEELSTTELQISDKLRWSVEALMERTRSQGFSSAAYSLLLLFEESCLDSLLAVLGQHSHQDIKTLVQQVERRRGGSLVYPTELGRLGLYVQMLDAESLARVGRILPACNGVFAWLGGDTGDSDHSESLLADLGARLDQQSSWVDVVIVAEGTQALEAAERLADGRASWRTSSHRPRSVGAVLRYFPGPEA